MWGNATRYSCLFLYYFAYGCYVIKADVLIGTTGMCVWTVSLFACGGYIVLGTFYTSGIEIFAFCVYGLVMKACTRELVKWL